MEKEIERLRVLCEAVEVLHLAAVEINHPAQGQIADYIREIRDAARLYGRIDPKMEVFFLRPMQDEASDAFVATWREGFTFTKFDDSPLMSALGRRVSEALDGMNEEIWRG